MVEVLDPFGRRFIALERDRSVAIWAERAAVAAELEIGLVSAPFGQEPGRLIGSRLRRGDGRGAERWRPSASKRLASSSSWSAVQKFAPGGTARGPRRSIGGIRSFWRRFFRD